MTPLSIREPVPDVVLDHLGGLRTSVTVGRPDADVVVVAGDAEWPRRVVGEAKRSRAILVLDPIRVERGAAKQALDAAADCATAVRFGGAWLSSSVLDDLSDALTVSLGDPVLLDVRQLAGSGRQRERMELSLQLLLARLGLRPLSTVTRTTGRVLVQSGSLTRKDALVPFRRTALVSAASESRLELRLLFESGQLDLTLPDGRTAEPGTVTLSEPAGRTSRPTAFVSPYRHAMIALSEHLSGAADATGAAAPPALTGPSAVLTALGETL